MSSPFPNATILVVDDNSTNLEILHYALTQAGYNVRVEVDGWNVIDQIQLSLPDLVLLDVMLPGVDGFEICRQLKAMPLTESIPIIFMTALTDISDKLKGLQLGAVDYITKPFQQEEVLARVRLQLQLRYLSQALATQNAELKHLTNELEQRVQARTAELSQSLTDLKTTQIQLQVANAQLEEYALKLEQKVDERTHQLQKEVEERQRAETDLHHLVAGTAAVTGEAFFPALVRHLTTALGVRYALISELANEKLHTLAVWSQDQSQSNFGYFPEFTPCGIVLQQGTYCCPHQLKQKFPQDRDLQDMPVDSYLGVVLQGSNQHPIGTLCILDDKPMIEHSRLEALLRIFAARATAELERQQAIEELQALNRKLEVRVEQRTADLRQSQEYLQQLTENIESVFWMTNPGKNEIIYISPAYEKIWGYSQQELYRSPLNWFLCVHVDDRDRVKAAMSKQIQGGYDEEYRIIRPDGQLRWVRDRAFPIRDEAGAIYRIAGIAEDITEKKQIEEKLRLQERAITASSNGIVIVDARLPDNPTIFVNPAFERITGYSSAEVLGRNCRFLQASHSDQPGLQELRVALAKHQGCKVSLRNYRKDGSLFWNELSISPIYDDQGKLTHYIGIQTDISDNKQAEEQIKTSLQEKEVLLKEIHHRVKNNLLVVASLLDWQTDYVTDPTILKIFTESQHRIYSMALIHEKLYQSQNLDRVDLGEYLRTLSEHLIVSFNLDPTQIQFQYHLESVLLNIETATPCGLVVSELISNALEHAFKDGRTGQVWLEVRRHSGDQVSICIQDNGVGFPDGVDFRNTESLGLQLVCLLTQQLQGTLEMRREQGTTFQLTFSELNYRRRL